MQRLSLLRRAPVATLAGVALASAAIRFAVALQVRTPLYYPDEYLYAAISRSIAHGTLGKVHGARVPIGATVSYLVPLLTSPFWLVHDVAVAYRLSQAAASIAFACSAFAAYALARRVGVGQGGACIAGVLAVLIPSGAFTATLLNEPYAYPLFLVAVLCAVDAVATPSLRRVCTVGVLAVALCVAAGLQFLLFPPACVIAYIAVAPSVRSVRRRAAAAIVVALGCTGALAVVAAGLFAQVHAQLNALNYSVGQIAAWFGVNLFVLAVSSGWVIVPGAVIGVISLARCQDRRARAFAALSVVLVIGFLVEAAMWGSNGMGLYERFTFYASPLLAIAFVWSIGVATERRSLYAAIAYFGAGAAILLPLTSRLFGGDDHSPTLLGLSYGLIVHLSSPPIVWAPLLAVLAVGTGLVGVQRGHAVAIAAAAVCVVTSVAGSRALVDHNTVRPPRVSVPGSTAFLAYGGSDADSLDQILFWNPNVSRVVVLGGGEASDTFASTPAFATPRGLVTGANGTHVDGPFVVGPDTLALGGKKAPSLGGDLAVFTETPTVVAFGFYRQAGLIAPFGRVFAAAGGHGFRLVLRLSSIHGIQMIGLKCRSLPQQRLVVGRGGKTISISVPRHGARDCQFGLTSGAVETVGALHVIAKASLATAP